MSSGKGETHNPWDAQKLELTGSWSVSKKARRHRRKDGTREGTAMSPEFDSDAVILPAQSVGGHSTAERLSWDPDGETEVLEREALSDRLDDEPYTASVTDDTEVELLSEADPPSGVESTVDITIPSYGESSEISMTLPRVVQGRAQSEQSVQAEPPPSGFIVEPKAPFQQFQQQAQWVQAPLRTRPGVGEPPRIELRKRSRRTADRERVEVPLPAFAGPAPLPEISTSDAPIQVVGPGTGMIGAGIIAVAPPPTRMTPSIFRVDPDDVVYVRRAQPAGEDADPFRKQMLTRRIPGPEAHVPRPAWIGLLGQVLVWTAVVSGGVVLGVVVWMAVIAR